MRYEYSLLIRIFILLLPTISLFYTIFLPLTIYPSYLIFKLFYTSSISADTLIVNSQPLSFISACIAPYAYYLIMALILLTKDIKILARIKMFLLASLLILIANIARIIFLVIILFNFGYNAFQAIHIFFWYFVSTAYVIIIWIILIKIFKIDSIPVYSDFKHLLEHSFFKRKV